MYTPILRETYIFKNSMTSGDKGEAPDTIRRTRPPSFSFILLKTNLSHIGDGFLPKISENVDVEGKLSSIILVLF
jgi:hypothetical protein